MGSQRRQQPVEGVLFDFGYTLFGHAPGWEVVTSWAIDQGRDLPDDEARAIWQRIDDATTHPAEMALGRDLDAEVWDSRFRVLYALADEELPGLGAELHRSFHDPLDWHPYADALPTLQRLSEMGIPAGIASNTGWDVGAVVEHHRFGPHLAAVTKSYEVKSSKPDPAIFHAACDAIGLAPERVLMVGDDPVADRGALAAGLADVIILDRSTPLGGTHGLEAVFNFL